MDLDLSEEQEMLRGMVRGVCASYANLETVRELEDDPIGFPPELWKQMAALDLIGLMIPAEYGGSEMSTLEGAVVYTELGRALAPSPHFVSAVMAAGVLLRAGTDEQKQSWLPRIVVGRCDRHDRVAGTRERVRRRAASSCTRRPTATGSCSTGRSGTCRSPAPRPRWSCSARTGARRHRHRSLPRRPDRGRRDASSSS